jgi:hypothetical protein
MVSQRHSAIIIILLAGAVSAFASTDAWQQFRGKGFSIMYPGTWFKLKTLPDSLEILSPKYDEDRGIKHGQAQIAVGESLGSSLAEVINDNTQGVSVLSRRDISAEPESEQGCGELSEVVVKDVIQPPSQVRNYITTFFFCEADRQKIVQVILTNDWEGDKRQEQYQQVALRIAKSIRILK